MTEKNPNMLYFDDLIELTGEQTPTKVVNRLEADGIAVYNKRGKLPYTTVRMVEAAKGMENEYQQIEIG